MNPQRISNQDGLSRLGIYQLPKGDKKEIAKGGQKGNGLWVGIFDFISLRSISGEQKGTSGMPRWLSVVVDAFTRYL